MLQLLHRYFAFQARNDDISVGRSQSAIDHQYIAWIDASINHGFSLNSHEERGGGVLRWETRRYPFQKHWGVKARDGFVVTKQNAEHALHRMLVEYTVFWRDCWVGSTHGLAKCPTLKTIQLPGRREESV